MAHGLNKSLYLINNAGRAGRPPHMLPAEALESFLLACLCFCHKAKPSGVDERTIHRWMEEMAYGDITTSLPAQDCATDTRFKNSSILRIQSHLARA